jgi:DNA-binding PadR family transcriptional regulator
MSEAIDSPLAHEILSYLAENPDSQDTLEGIVQWWLLDRKIERQTTEVKEALASLVSDGFVIEQTTSDSRTHYRINPEKKADIREVLKKKSSSQS